MTTRMSRPAEPFSRINPEQAKQMIDSGAMIVDVREPDETKTGHVPGAVLMPVNSVYNRVNELPKDKDLIFICAVGQRSALAAEIAAAMGYSRLFNVDGGTDAWRSKGFPLQK